MMNCALKWLTDFCRPSCARLPPKKSAAEAADFCIERLRDGLAMAVATAAVAAPVETAAVETTTVESAAVEATAVETTTTAMPAVPADRATPAEPVAPRITAPIPAGTVPAVRVPAIILAAPGELGFLDRGEAADGVLHSRLVGYGGCLCKRDHCARRQSRGGDSRKKHAHFFSLLKPEKVAKANKKTLADRSHIEMRMLSQSKSQSMKSSAWRYIFSWRPEPKMNSCSLLREIAPRLLTSVHLGVAKRV
jgi:hypothetical protein